jgi:SAM-dependent methyltransferase
MNNNIAYQTDQLARYFASNRITWEQFYESERAIFTQLHLDGSHRVLDIGCGCGGLGIALRERFGVQQYVGAEINLLAVEVGRKMNPNAQFLCGDILDLSCTSLCGEYFDLVVSLSCIDWNIEFVEMLNAAWSHVLPGGYLVSTFRLTTEAGCRDLDQSYQYISCDGLLEGERAPYVVVNAKTLATLLLDLNPSAIRAHGYWGTPSATAITPYEKLCFSAVSLRKRAPGDLSSIRQTLSLPEEISDLVESTNGRSLR